MVKISAIISLYNSEKFIRGKIEDLLQQTIATQLEIIIVNSGSTQNEKIIIEEYLSANKNIKYLETLERETIYKAWNRGINESVGEYITNANSDDRLRKDAYEILSTELDANTEIALVYADQYISNNPNETLLEFKGIKKYFRSEYSRLNLLSNYEIGSQSMWRASLHRKDNIYFNEKYEVAGDYDFCCQISENNKIKKINMFLGLCYRSNEFENKELQNIENTNKETLEVREKYLRRFLKTISVSEQLMLIKKVDAYLLLPTFLHIILFRLSKQITIFNQLLPRGFVCWIGSIISEIQGNIREAKKYCTKGNNIQSAIFLRSQLEKLNKLP
ncbi:MAG: glycosyltransferase [Ignavibacteria bacterium]|nr:glycosyltransferase [Ignavibacteria bacterium]